MADQRTWGMLYGDSLYLTKTRLTLELQLDAMKIASPKSLDYLTIESKNDAMLRALEDSGYYVINLDEDK